MSQPEACPPPPPLFSSSCPNGFCANSTTACGCPPGFTSRGDFTLGPACFLHVDLLRAAWGAGTLLSALQTAYAAFFLRFHIRHRAASSAVSKRARRNMLVYGSFALCAGVVITGLGVARAVDFEGTAVGVSLATIPYSIACTLFWAQILLSVRQYLEVFLGTQSLRGYEELRAIRKAYGVHTRIAVAGVAVAMLSPIIALAQPTNPKMLEGVCVVHIIGALFCIIYLGFAFLHLVSGLEGIVSEAVTTMQDKVTTPESLLQFHAILAKMKRARRDLLIQAVPVIVMNVAFGGVLQSLSSYTVVTGTMYNAPIGSIWLLHLMLPVKAQSTKPGASLDNNNGNGGGGGGLGGGGPVAPFASPGDAVPRLEPQDRDRDSRRERGPSGPDPAAAAAAARDSKASASDAAGSLSKGGDAAEPRRSRP